ncbi:hypothetical protein [Lewinella cohaerens]|uniref:hypothetical protein n=1 Tax=Lewinella cohaerens TaxID=70995 RepID=UPI00035F8C79|nr:hypothetical protein [Lewinella cohaerens]
MKNKIGFYFRAVPKLDGVLLVLLVFRFILPMDALPVRFSDFAKIGSSIKILETSVNKGEKSLYFNGEW